MRVLVLVTHSHYLSPVAWAIASLKDTQAFGYESVSVLLCWGNLLPSSRRNCKNKINLELFYHSIARVSSPRIATDLGLTRTFDAGIVAKTWRGHRSTYCENRISKAVIFETSVELDAGIVAKTWRGHRSKHLKFDAGIVADIYISLQRSEDFSC